jgi:hypothetical protein
MPADIRGKYARRYGLNSGLKLAGRVVHTRGQRHIHL